MFAATIELLLPLLPSVGAFASLYPRLASIIVDRAQSFAFLCRVAEKSFFFIFEKKRRRAAAVVSSLGGALLSPSSHPPSLPPTTHCTAANYYLMYCQGLTTTMTMMAAMTSSTMMPMHIHLRVFFCSCFASCTALHVLDAAADLLLDVVQHLALRLDQHGHV